MSSFHVDARVSVKLEYDLAMRLGEFILSSGTEDKQFLALGHKLVRIDEDDQQQQKPMAKRPWVENQYDMDENRNEYNQTQTEYPVNDAYWDKQERMTDRVPPIKLRRSNKFSKNI